MESVIDTFIYLTVEQWIRYKVDKYQFDNNDQLRC